MTRYSFERIDAHNSGDCDSSTCPLCEYEYAQEDK